MARPQKFRHPREELHSQEVAKKLGQFVIEIEALRRQREAIDEQIAAAYDAVDESGFEKKFVRKVIALRAKESGVRRDEEEGLDCYEYAIEKGVSLARTRRKPENSKSQSDADVVDLETGEIIEQPEQPLDGGPHVATEEPVPFDNANTSGAAAEGRQSAAYSEVAQAEAAGRGSAPVQVSNPALATNFRSGPDGQVRGEGTPTSLAGKDERLVSETAGRSSDESPAFIPHPQQPTSSPARADNAPARSSSLASGQPITDPHGMAVLRAATAGAGAGNGDAPASSFNRFARLRPHCLRPELCAGSGDKHCHACTKAMKTEQVPA